jgi:hypothetical protein
VQTSGRLLLGRSIVTIEKMGQPLVAANQIVVAHVSQQRMSC